MHWEPPLQSAQQTTVAGRVRGLCFQKATKWGNGYKISWLQPCLLLRQSFHLLLPQQIFERTLAVAMSNLDKAKLLPLDCQKATEAGL